MLDVSSADVQAVAARYLRADQRVVLTYLPGAGKDGES